MKQRPGPSVSNTTQILIGLILGVLVGYLFPSSDAGGVHVAGFAEQIKPLADVFLRMIKMIIAPLLFSTLVVGIAGTGDMKTMGRIGLKAILYFEIATTIALFLGLALVNLFKPGAGMALPLGATLAAALAVPLARALGDSWSRSLATWALVALPAVGVALALGRSGATRIEGPRPAPLRRTASRSTPSSSGSARTRRSSAWSRSPWTSTSPSSTRWRVRRWSRSPSSWPIPTSRS